MGQRCVVPNHRLIAWCCIIYIYRMKEFTSLLDSNWFLFETKWEEWHKPFFNQDVVWRNLAVCGVEKLVENLVVGAMET